MERGIVIWFSDLKGYGFIRPLKGGSDAFVHHSSIVKDGYRTLRKAEFVDFELVDRKGRAAAINVTPIASGTGGNGDGQQ